MKHRTPEEASLLYHEAKARRVYAGPWKRMARKPRVSKPRIRKPKVRKPKVRKPTPQCIEVMAWLSRGLHQAEIAKKVGTTRQNVHAMIKRALRRDSRAAAEGIR